MREFPKMLYLGTTQAHQHEVAQNQDHEAELRELGFVDFAELADEVNQTEDYIKDMRTGKPKTVLQGDYDQVLAERDQFKAENDDLKAQLHQEREANQQLQQIIDSYQPEPTIQAQTVATDYKDLTSDQLRVMLDEKKIKYLARDNKDTLIDLLTQPTKTEE
ncbi:hypothetical protein [Acinetobacter silvestris]|uniref:Uncharacterized protein n=1 Tax=Acinetobacter silvestris TaxID=1977882 RepID=A0A1Y3CFF0_9GAMM|nr:hypothetical protein [Acinetobacter silvestris]OTG65831.1 hypothetical protein B9T28_06425 [Acinetobacter silvestris]